MKHEDSKIIKLKKHSNTVSSKTAPKKKSKKEQQSDKIDKSSADSFPASDPPAWTGTSISKEEHSEDDNENKS